MLQTALANAPTGEWATQGHCARVQIDVAQPIIDRLAEVSRARMQELGRPLVQAAGELAVAATPLLRRGPR